MRTMYLDHHQVIDTHTTPSLSLLQEDQHPPVEVEAEEDSEEYYIKARITGILRNYPILSPSMLQLGMGPAMRARIWKPVLEAMIKEGLIIREFISTPSERGGFRTICRIMLAAETE